MARHLCYHISSIFLQCVQCGIQFRLCFPISCTLFQFHFGTPDVTLYPTWVCLTPQHVSLVHKVHVWLPFPQTQRHTDATFRKMSSSLSTRACLCPLIYYNGEPVKIWHKLHACIQFQFRIGSSEKSLWTPTPQTIFPQWNKQWESILPFVGDILRGKLESGVGGGVMRAKGLAIDNYFSSVYIGIIICCVFIIDGLLQTWSGTSPMKVNDARLQYVFNCPY